MSVALILLGMVAVAVWIVRRERKEAPAPSKPKIWCKGSIWTCSDGHKSGMGLTPEQAFHVFSVRKNLDI